MAESKPMLADMAEKKEFEHRESSVYFFQVYRQGGGGGGKPYIFM
jgi:hypothetical protein